MQKSFLPFVFLLVCVLGCESRTETRFENSFYELVPEAPLSLYCLLDNSLDMPSRLTICEILESDMSKVSVDFMAEIRGSKFIELTTGTTYFKGDVLYRRDTAENNNVNKIF